MSREPMTMYDMLLAAQLMSEERVGKVIRQHHHRENAKEDAMKRHLLREVKS